MTPAINSRRPGGWRICALTAAVLVAGIFVAANTHLVMISLRSQPDCVAQTVQKGTATYRAANPSC